MRVENELWKWAEQTKRIGTVENKKAEYRSGREIGTQKEHKSKKRWGENIATESKFKKEASANDDTEIS